MHNAWIACANNLPAQRDKTYLQHPFMSTHLQPFFHPAGRTVPSLTAISFQPLLYLQLSILRLYILISIHPPSHRPIVDSPTCPASSTPTPGLGAAAPHLQGADRKRRQQEGRAAASAGQPVQMQKKSAVNSSACISKEQMQMGGGTSRRAGPQLLQVNLYKYRKRVRSTAARAYQRNGCRWAEAPAGGQGRSFCRSTCANAEKECAVSGT